jgi:hypothetical protein
MRPSRTMMSVPARLRISRSAVSPACSRFTKAGAVFHSKSGAMPVSAIKRGSRTSMAGWTAMELKTFT